MYHRVVATNKITITEANEVIARHVFVTALRDDTMVTMGVVETAVKSFLDQPEHTRSHQWGLLCNVRTAYREVVKKLISDGRRDLIVQQPSIAQKAFLKRLVVAGGTMVTAPTDRGPSNATVCACRDRGWVAPHESFDASAPHAPHVPWSPWTITPTGRDAAVGAGHYRR